MTEILCKLKWAAFFFVATLLWMVFEKLMGWHGARISDHALYSNAYDLVFALLFILAFREKRRHEIGQRLTWRQGFRFGLTLIFLITLLSPLIQIITHKIISPAFFPNIIQLAVSNNLLSQTEAASRFNLSSYILQNITGTFLLGSACTVVLAFIFQRKT